MLRLQQRHLQTVAAEEVTVVEAAGSARCGRYLTRLYYDPDGKMRKK